MEIGKAYLIHCGDWHTFVGRVEAQIGPYTYRFGKGTSSKIHDTHNGDNWGDLAAGDTAARKVAEYRHDKTLRTVVLNLTCCEWVGKTPAEEGL